MLMQKWGASDVVQTSLCFQGYLPKSPDFYFFGEDKFILTDFRPSMDRSYPRTGFFQGLPNSRDIQGVEYISQNQVDVTDFFRKNKFNSQHNVDYFAPGYFISHYFAVEPDCRLQANVLYFLVFFFCRYVNFE